MTVRETELPRETLQKIQIFEVHKLDLFPMAGTIGKSWSNLIFFLKKKKLELTPCKAEQPLQAMELQEKETQKD